MMMQKKKKKKKKNQKYINSYKKIYHSFTHIVFSIVQIFR